MKRLLISPFFCFLFLSQTQSVVAEAAQTSSDCYLEYENTEDHNEHITATDDNICHLMQKKCNENEDLSGSNHNFYLNVLSCTVPENRPYYANDFCDKLLHDCRYAVTKNWVAMYKSNKSALEACLAVVNSN